MAKNKSSFLMVLLVLAGLLSALVLISCEGGGGTGIRFVPVATCGFWLLAGE